MIHMYVTLSLNRLQDLKIEKMKTPMMLMEMLNRRWEVVDVMASGLKINFK